MPRYDISRIRKEHGMSQSELAQRLQITQSFLSAIENGRSPLPIEKEEKLREVFSSYDLSSYIQDKTDDEKRVVDMTDSDLFNQLLNRFHRQAHSAEGEHHHHDHHEKIEILENRVEALFKRNDALMERNDRLAEANDLLRQENDKLRSEIDRLRAQIFNLKS